ncbi:RagB/SusD family nutrient uptake outer membrane protein [Gramella lutea]|uniref:RagB/SusD family nutrient uptake outer membrane protein n=1 Tax=Christiangramia lutea TaxID=1607951 RepID=A0A9X1V266_9FLAO|nr:RagB/SusD family nutrient uptake outer membrane protein [Christiangramia lutea]MCH4822661.1 RagB/SusD family nutrient uptake outer membrane protein [Christiangramia lutea]
MKNIHKFLIITLLLGSLAGCSDILEVELDDEIRSTEAITDGISLRSAVTGLYSLAQSGTYYGGEFIMAQALTGGIADATGFRERFTQLDNAIIPASSIYVESSWVDAYALVNSSNLILEKVDELQLDDPESQGAAHFFRALGLFDALRQFGQFRDMNSEFGIPVFTQYIDSETAKTIPRSTVAASYDQIISDLEMAISLMEYDSEKFTVSKGTAEAFLSRVHLYAGNYEEAEQYATLAIENHDYALNGNYNDIYETEGSAEAIFELQFTETDGNTLTEYLSVSPPEVSASFEDFYAAMSDDDDPRGDLYFDDGRVVFVDKYGINDATVDGNAIIMKLSEVYLNRAEARARMGEFELALEDLNMVRTRSLPDMAITLEEVSDFESFTDVLIEERAREMAFEGHRWFDIVRLGRAESILGIETFRTVYPVPQREIVISNGTLVQNPGY